MWLECDTFFYGVINLAKPLTGGRQNSTLRANRINASSIHERRAEMKRPAGFAPAGLGELQYRRGYIFTPFSVKYFTAPGCHGIAELALVCLARSMFFASPCTATRSALCSMNVLTIS